MRKFFVSLFSLTLVFFVSGCGKSADEKEVSKAKDNFDKKELVKIPKKESLPKDTHFIVSYKKNDYVSKELKSFLDDIGEAIEETEDLNRFYELTDSIDEFAMFVSIQNDIDLDSGPKPEDICVAVYTAYSDNKDLKKTFDEIKINAEMVGATAENKDGKYFLYSKACKDIKVDSIKTLNKIVKDTFEGGDEIATLNTYVDVKGILEKIPKVKKYLKKDELKKLVLTEIKKGSLDSDKEKLLNKIVESSIDEIWEANFTKLLLGFETGLIKYNFEKDVVDISGVTKFTTEESAKLNAEVSTAQIAMLNDLGKEDVTWFYKSDAKSDGTISENIQRKKGVKNIVSKDDKFDDDLKSNLDSFGDKLIIAGRYNKNEFSNEKIDEIYKEIYKILNEAEKKEADKNFPIVKQVIENIDSVAFGVEFNGDLSIEEEPNPEKDGCAFVLIKHKSEVVKSGLTQIPPSIAKSKKVDSGDIIYTNGCGDKYNDEDKIVKALKGFDDEKMFIEIYVNKKIAWSKIEKIIKEGIEKELGEKDFEITFENVTNLIYKQAKTMGPLLTEIEDKKIEKLTKILDDRFISKIPMYFCYKSVVNVEKIYKGVGINKDVFTKKLSFEFSGEEKEELAKRSSNHIRHSAIVSKIFGDDKIKINSKHKVDGGVSINEVIVENYDFIYVMFSSGGVSVVGNLFSAVGQFSQMGKAKSFDSDITTKKEFDSDKTDSDKTDSDKTDSDKTDSDKTKIPVPASEVPVDSNTAQ